MEMLSRGNTPWGNGVGDLVNTFCGFSGGVRVDGRKLGFLGYIVLCSFCDFLIRGSQVFQKMQII